MRAVCVLCLVLCLITELTKAQSYSQDTLFVVAAEANGKKIYSGAIRNQSQLYNGTDFKVYQSLKDEHPFLFSDDWITGTVQYDGNIYEDVPIQYDIQNDEVIIEYYNGIRSIRLIKPKVQYFTLERDKFVMLTDPQLSTGFYQVLYDGQTKVYARHSKTLQETISGREIQHSFTERTKYYVFSKGSYHLITGKGAVLDVFKDKKKELNQFAKKNKLGFRKNKAAYITQLADYYDNHQ